MNCRTTQMGDALAKRSHWQLLYRMKRATVRSDMLLQSKRSCQKEMRSRAVPTAATLPFTSRLSSSRCDDD